MGEISESFTVKTRYEGTNRSMTFVIIKSVTTCKNYQMMYLLIAGVCFGMIYLFKDKSVD